ncbi:MAG: thioredoxin, partial [Ignavibacteriales bacterium]
MALDTENFETDVIERSFSIPVLVDFWAEWCGPCKVLGPILEKLAQKYNGLFDLVKLNTDRFSEIAAQYNVRGIPNVKLFINGEVINEFTGAVPEPQVDEWIRKNIPGKNDKISLIKELIISGKEDEALGMLNQLKKESDNKEINVLLAQAILFKEPEKALSLTEGVEQGNMEVIDSVRFIGSLLSRYSKNELPEGVVKKEYIDSVKALKEKNFSKALEGFIDIIRNDRNYDDDGA